jgi:hypothetical protein
VSAKCDHLLFESPTVVKALAYRAATESGDIAVRYAAHQQWSYSGALGVIAVCGLVW